MITIKITIKWELIYFSSLAREIKASAIINKKQLLRENLKVGFSTRVPIVSTYSKYILS